MALTDEERAFLRELAQREGRDPDALVGAAEDDDGEDPEERGPGKSDAAAQGKGGAPTGAESNVRAHGGRGYFAYEFPFLTVNEVRTSLFLDTVTDGGLFTGEWLKKHGGEPDKGGAPTE